MAISTKERNAKICSMFLDGATLEEIGKKYAISKQRVSKILHSMGIEVRVEKEKKNKEKYDKLTKEMYEKYHEKAKRHAKVNEQLNNARTMIKYKDVTITKLQEEIKALKDNSYYMEEITELRKKVNNLTCLVNYYKKKENK